MGGTDGPRACEGCLRRSWLLADLSGHIERAVAREPGRRAPELLALEDAELARALSPREADRLLARASSRNEVELQRAVVAAGAWACCPHGRGFPRSLTGPEAPKALFGRGDPGPLDALGDPGGAVTLVGARRASAYGRELSETLGRELAAAGLTVVSGMAFGVDARAHSGALAAGGLTAAVLGSGVDVPYPRALAGLYGRLVERGLVLSELPPGTAARRWTFPARNRVMAALSAITVVVEARERSGSLITAAMAAELGREVGAVPGRVGNATAEGCNALIRDGAHVIRDAQDVLDSILGAEGIGSRAVRRAAPGPPLGGALAAILELVERGASDPDAVAREGKLEPAVAAAGLARLELLGYLRSDSGGCFERTALGCG